MSTQRFRLTPAHLDLLLACLAEPARAVSAWQRWRPTADLDDHDSGTHRLLPLALQNLAGTVDADDTRKLRAKARFAWLRSELQIVAARGAAAALRDAGIPTMAIKGLAVLHHTGRTVATRPMDDADLLVPTAQAAEALRLLVGAGWTTWTAVHDPHSLDPLLAGSHAIAVEDARHAQVDLHWHALATSLHPGADLDLWRRGEVHGETTDLVASREDTLLHVLAHAGRFATAPAVAWVADVVALVGSAPDLDWSLVLAEAARHRVAPQVADAIEVVRSLDLVDLPAVPRPRWSLARVGTRALTRPPARAEELVRSLSEHTARTRAPGARPQPGAWLTERWARPRGTSPWHHVPYVMTRRPWSDPRPSGTTGLVGVELGRTVDLTVGGDGLAALGPGWSFPEPHGTWTQGREAELVLQLAEADPGPLRLQVLMTPLLAPLRPVRLVDVSANGQHCGRWTFTGEGWHSESREVALPPIVGRTIAVRFTVHRPVSPQDLLTGMRSLPTGLSVSSLVLLPA